MLQMLNICKSFNSYNSEKNIVFNGLHLNVNSGDFITIIGSNGAGKSTLLNLLSGSLSIDDGEILLENRNISNMPEYLRTRFIGRVFQDPALGTSPSMTILENLSMACNKGKRFNLTPGVNKKAVGYFKEILSELSLGLEDKLNTKVGQLSGGQRQALSLLMATLSNPKLILLDEHTAALDPKTSEIILDLTQRIVREKNITTLMITHNLNHAITIGNRLIMLHHGKIVLDLNEDQKRNLTIDGLLELFKEKQDEDLISDRILFS